MIDLGINLFQEIAALGGGGGFSITNSLRFNDDDSAYLSRTPSVAGNRKTWTWSGWVKRGNLGTTQNLFFSREAATAPLFGFYFVNDNLIIQYYDGTSKNITTNAVFRDASGWYHIVLTLDTTQAVASDRVKMYVNGEQITSFSVATYPALNQVLTVNSAYRFDIANDFLSGGGSGGNYFDGYLAEINFIDGQALTADDFGEIDATTGEWSPKAYSGTYGTNGFYLPFNGNANDSSGNGNNWTENNLASTDYMIDTPTNNFSVLNPLAKGTSTTLSEGNLRFTSSQTYAGVLGSVGVTSGKWYWEGLTTTSASAATFGIGNQNTNINTYLGIGIDFGYLSNGTIYGPNDTTTQSGLATYTTGDIIGITMDMDAGEVKFYKNNSLVATVSSVDTSVSRFPTLFDNSSANNPDLVANFGADSSFAGNKTRQGNTDSNGKGDFYYTPPAGFLALCEDNLETPPPSLNPSLFLAFDSSTASFVDTGLIT